MGENIVQVPVHFNKSHSSEWQQQQKFGGSQALPALEGAAPSPRLPPGPLWCHLSPSSPSAGGSKHTAAGICWATC